MRIVLIGNMVNWFVCATFTLRSSIVLLTIGMFVWLLLIPVIEAAEQTVLQRSVPFERQGRVFGFAQLVENAASPVTALLIGPIAENYFMPTMTDGAGADLIGDWFGTGPTAPGLDLHAGRAVGPRRHRVRPLDPVVPEDRCGVKAGSRRLHAGHKVPREVLAS